MKIAENEHACINKVVVTNNLFISGSGVSAFHVARSHSNTYFHGRYPEFQLIVDG